MEETLEKIFKNYKEWLLKKYEPDVASSMMSRLRRLFNNYDVLGEYASDKCASIIDELTYSKEELRCGIEPKTSIIIEGDYYSGLSSLKNSLCEFLKYLNEIGYGTAEKKKSKVLFEGSFDDFKKYIGPKCRNEVNIFCKSERESHKSICEYCGCKAELQSAHITERPVIMKDILDAHYQIGEDLYRVDLDEFFVYFKEAHMPISQKIFFLCPKCHTDLDKNKTITVDDIKSKRSSL